MTRTTWQETYGETFGRAGAMWRGDPPHTWMARVPCGLFPPRRMFSFRKGSFQSSTVKSFTWAFKVYFVFACLFVCLFVQRQLVHSCSEIPLCISTSASSLMICRLSAHFIILFYRSVFAPFEKKIMFISH